LSGIAACFLLALGPAFLAQQRGNFWLPERASSGAGAVDDLFHFILYLSIFFFLLIVVVALVFVLRYRRRPGHTEQASPQHNLALEITWSVIPIILVIFIFYFGFRDFMDMATPPADAQEIAVTGQKWKWLFTYPNGHVDDELHVPVDEPVKLVLTSEDVIHSLFIPAFRLKRDAVPGRYSKIWFRATKPGQYPALCAEYCGTGHSDMHTWVVVHEPGGYEQWLEKAADFVETLSPAEAGERLYKTRGCAQCHSIDGSGSIGPTFQGLYGETQALRGGSSVTVDENYVRESIQDPQAKVVAGFEPVMPTYKGKLSDREITAIIAYLKSLSSDGGEQPAGGGEGAE
jgi:cytochrome c oxidase subunit 2